MIAADWSCPKKRLARLETIINPYRQNFGPRLPSDRQYWTMCGKCATTDGQRIRGCEPHQMFYEGLISPDQFHGVERNPEIHVQNAKAYPEIAWYNDDFYRAMLKAKANGGFTPGIVNADTHQTPDGTSFFVAKILALLSDMPGNILFVANFVLRARYYEQKDGDYIVERLNACPPFQAAMSDGRWRMWDEYYEYGGAGRKNAKTRMGTLRFFKFGGDQAT
jgi:hypothetical protein